MLKELYVKTGYVLCVVALWTLLFYANGYFFDAAEIDISHDCS